MAEKERIRLVFSEFQLSVSITASLMTDDSENKMNMDIYVLSIIVKETVVTNPAHILLHYQGEIKAF